MGITEVLGISGAVNDVLQTIAGLDYGHIVALIALAALVSVPAMLYLVRRPVPKNEENNDTMQNAVALVTTTMQPVIDLSRNIARQNELQEEANKLKEEEIRQRNEQIEAQQAGIAALSEKTIMEAKHTTKIVESGLQGQNTLLQAMSESLIKSNQTVVESVEKLAKQIETQASKMVSKEDFTALLTGLDVRIAQTWAKGYQSAQEQKLEPGEAQNDPAIDMAKVIRDNV